MGSEFRVIHTSPPGLSSQQARLLNCDAYDVGQAHGWLQKSASDAETVPIMKGRLVISKSGWGLLEVPNALVRGIFDTLSEPGIELPAWKGQFNAHISVFRGDEVEAIGGPEKINERGKLFTYQLGPIQTVQPKTWAGVSRVWFVKVTSPELQNLRKSYGLTPKMNGTHDFHITIAVRKTSVLKPNAISKAAYLSESGMHTSDTVTDDCLTKLVREANLMLGVA